MDAMVTARMPAGKKEAGNAILRELGLSASQVINELYDYLILKKSLPFGHAVDLPLELSLDKAYEFVDGLPKVSLEQHYLDLDAKDARRERLARHMRHDVTES